MFRIGLVVLACITLTNNVRAAEPAADANTLAKMPITEVTAFKDGHAFVVHEGVMATDAEGNVTMDYLPTPVLGTFWPFCNDKKAKLHAVVTGRRRVKIERTAITLRDLIEANLGAEVIVSEGKDGHYPATILRFLSRSAEEVAATSATHAPEPVPVKGNLLLLKTADGTRAVAVERITDVKFLGKFQTTITEEEYRNVLTMRLDWNGNPPEKTVRIGMAYLQKGIRWIPNYRVEIDGKGKAFTKLQATVLDELADLSKATLHLVVGVPSFYFKETTDPIALSQALAPLSPYFQTDASTQHALSNAMMTQVARGGEVRQPGGNPAAAVNLGPEIGGSGKSEDLFIFTVKEVSMKKGQRLVLPVAQFSLDYKDVYVLNMPYVPPSELRRTTGDNPQLAELLKLMNAPKVTHNLRLMNGGAMPLTTAPVLIMKDNQVLAQSMMTYTARGAAVDLALTTAVDVKAKKTDRETKRTPNAASFNGESLWKIDVAGNISLTNYRSDAIELEVVRFVLGNLGEATQEGKSEMMNRLEDDEHLSTGRPAWWHYYSWPYWWGHLNGIGKVSWTKKLEPGKSIDLDYTWHYFWK